MLVYDYVIKNKKQITFMTVRELAAAVHVSTSTVVRFCKKIGCEGYTEFRIKFKLYLNETKEEKPQQDIDELIHYYGARYFSNLRKYSQHIDDLYYPVLEDMYEGTVVVALSVSGETLETIQLANRFKEHNSQIIAITNKASSTLSKLSDLTLSYFVSEKVTENKYNITTQVPVLFLIEVIGKRL